MPVEKNSRADDHFIPGNEYLMYIDTDAVGNYKASSIDNEKLGKLEAQVHANGYSISQHTHSGDSTVVQDNGHKEMVDSHTSTTTGHIDVASGGGIRSNHNQGQHTESGESSTAAHNGSFINASKNSAKTLSEDGNGHHVMKGDQSFMVQEGGMHYGVTKDFSVTSKGTIHHNASDEYSVYVDGNEGHTSGKSVSFDAAQNISHKAGTQISLTVGGSSIVITSQNIILTVGGSTVTVSNKDITINSKGTVNIYAEGDITTNGMSTKLQGGGVASPPISVR